MESNKLEENPIFNSKNENHRKLFKILEKLQPRYQFTKSKLKTMLKVGNSWESLTLYKQT